MWKFVFDWLRWQKSFWTARMRFRVMIMIIRLILTLTMSFSLGQIKKLFLVLFSRWSFLPYLGYKLFMRERMINRPNSFNLHYSGIGSTPFSLGYHINSNNIRTSLLAFLINLKQNFLSQLVHWWLDNNTKSGKLLSCSLINRRP